MIKSTFKQIKREYLLPLLLQYVILAGLMVLFSLFLSRGPMIGEIRQVGDEMTSPTAGRLAYGAVALTAFFLLTAAASKAAKAGKDVRAFWYGFTAGILLWQVAGEIAWHYSVGGVNFVVLEDVMSFPVAVLFALLLVYGGKNHSFDWGVWCMLLSFACNWFGHYIMLGLYPFVENIIPSRIWNVCVALIAGVLFFLYSVWFLLFRAKTTRDRLMASLMSYISLAVIYFGFAEG